MPRRHSASTRILRSQRTLLEPLGAKKHTLSTHRTQPLRSVRLYPGEEAMLDTISVPALVVERAEGVPYGKSDHICRLLRGKDVSSEQG